MVRVILILSLVICHCLSYGQVTTQPQLPNDSQRVKIIFDATKGTGGLADYSGDVYAHIGVITNLSSSNSDWKYVKTDWGVNTSETLLTRTSSNIYELDLEPNIRSYFGVPQTETITHIALVFRSSDSSLEGKATGNSDIFIQVFEEGLNLTINSPQHASIFEDGENINFSTTTNEDATIQLFQNNTLLSTTIGTVLNHEIEASSGDYWLKAVATTSGETIADSVYVSVANPVVSRTIPSSLVEGINYNESDPTKATLVVYAPQKERIHIIGDFNEWLPNNSYMMYRDGNYFWLTIDNLVANREYIFQYLIDGQIRIGDPYADKISDPYDDKYIPESTYPNLIEYPVTKTSNRATVLQTAQSTFDWQHLSYVAPQPEELVIYELLFRDFTEEGTINAAMQRMDYLQQLGINAIHLMPFNEFEGNSSWGYNPNFYFATDKAYGTKDDYKRFIDECHKRNIVVIQDIVLNHAFNSSPMVRMYWDEENNRPAANNPWFNTQSNFTNPNLQWGSDFNHESPATQKLVDRILKYWVEEYKIDGFRFDFTKGFGNNLKSGTDEWGSNYDADRIALLKRMTTQLWSYKKDAYVIFEHLANNDEETELANFGIMLWGNMNHNFNEATMGYTENNKSDLTWASWKTREWNQPNLIAYMESHDEERLMYKNIEYGNSYGTYDVTNLQTALKRNELATIFFFSLTGPKMIWQFGEMGYDISINEGGRTSEKPVLWNYLEQKDRLSLHNKYQAMIRLRNEYDVFNSGKEKLNLASEIKQISLSDDNLSVVTVGNFDVTSHMSHIEFPNTGTWYDYFSNQTIEVGQTNKRITLNAGEYRMYTNRDIGRYSDSYSDGIPPIEPNTDLTITPNPVVDQFTIQFSESISSIDIYNITGAKIMTTTNKTANISHLKAGIYIVSIKTDTGATYNKRIIKN